MRSIYKANTIPLIHHSKKKSLPKIMIQQSECFNNIDVHDRNLPNTSTLPIDTLKKFKENIKVYDKDLKKTLATVTS